MKSKKILMCVLLLMAALIISACGGDGTDNGQTPQNGDQGIKPMKLTASSGLPATHKWQVAWYEPLMEQITEKTDGAVTFDVFTSGELVPLRGEYDALNQKQIDLALSFFPYYDTGGFPLTQVTYLPAFGTTPEIDTKTYHDLFYSDVAIQDGKTYKQLEYDDKGIVVFPGISTNGSYVMVTSGQELNAVNKFNSSVKLRTTGWLDSALVKNLGITPITVHSGDVYDSLSRGAINGLVQDPNWVVYGYADQLSYGLRGYGLGFTHAMIAFTQEQWDSFPAELQDIIAEACEAPIDSAIKVLEEAEKECWDYIEGVGVIDDFENLDPEVQKHLSDAVAQTWMQWIEMLEADGLPGKNLAMLWRDCLLENGADVPQEIKDLK